MRVLLNLAVRLVFSLLLIVCLLLVLGSGLSLLGETRMCGIDENRKTSLAIACDVE